MLLNSSPRTTAVSRLIDLSTLHRPFNLVASANIGSIIHNPLPIPPKEVITREFVRPWVPLALTRRTRVFESYYVAIVGRLEPAHLVVIDDAENEAVADDGIGRLCLDTEAGSAPGLVEEGVGFSDAFCAVSAGGSDAVCPVAGWVPLGVDAGGSEADDDCDDS